MLLALKGPDCHESPLAGLALYAQNKYLQPVASRVFSSLRAIYKADIEFTFPYRAIN
jgi:hypothetical protein